MIRLRSLLALGSAEEGLAEALACGADAWEVSPGRAGGLAGQSLGAELFLKLSGDAGSWDGDCAGLAGLPFRGVTAPCRSGADIQRLAAKLAVAEARLGLPDGRLGVIAIAASAQSVLSLASFAGANARLLAISSDPAAVRAELGAPAPATLALLHALLPAVACAAAVPALHLAASETEPASFERECAFARRDGYRGLRLAAPWQAKIANRHFG